FACKRPVIAFHCITQLIVKGFLNDIESSNFAENRGNKQPIISRTYSTIFAYITVKSSSRKPRNIWRFPSVFVRSKRVGIRSMLGIISIHNTTLWYGILCLTDQHPIHIYLISLVHFLHEKLMLRRNIFL